MASKKVWVWVGQGVLAIGLLWFGGRAVASRWDEFRSLQVGFTPRPGWIAGSAVVVWLTYAVLIEAWRRVLRGWHQELPWRRATRIWCLSNLGRYLPGKVWSVAGLAAMAQAAGVSGWAAVGSALVLQVLALGSGALVVGLATPQAASPAALLGAVLFAGVTVVCLMSERLGTWAVRRLRPGLEFRALPPAAALLGFGATLASWIGYGVAFWMLARGLLTPVTPSFLIALGVFAAGYILGLLALFAPGGVGVRELVFVTLLTPVTGVGAALGLSVASRLLLTVTELGAAAMGLALVKRRGGGSTS